MRQPARGVRRGRMSAPLASCQVGSLAPAGSRIAASTQAGVWGAFCHDCVRRPACCPAHDRELVLGCQRLHALGELRNAGHHCLFRALVLPIRGGGFFARMWRGFACMLCLPGRGGLCLPEAMRYACPDAMSLCLPGGGGGLPAQTQRAFVFPVAHPRGVTD